MAAGYINPTTNPVYDDALEDVFHAVIKGLTGINERLIRPRWQSETPNQPDFDEDWVAFGITTDRADAFAYHKHLPAGNGGLGAEEVQRDEELQVLHSFYGPNCTAMMARYRDGIQLSQNRYDLTQAGIKLVSLGDATRVPALLKKTWVNRVDVRIAFRRRTTRVYNVPSLISAEMTLDNEHYTTPINVPNP